MSSEQIPKRLRVLSENRSGRPFFLSQPLSFPLKSDADQAVVSIGGHGDHGGHLGAGVDRRITGQRTKLGGLVIGDAALREELCSSFEDFIRGLLSALEVRDPAIIAHSRRVTTYTLLLAEELGVDQGVRDQLSLGAILHDVGKIAIPDSVLQKSGALSAAEWALIQRHPVIGYNMLKPVLVSFPVALDMVRHHHERYDGSGYPDGLAGLDIPFAARILALADAFDVMTNDRPYKPARSIQQARAEVAACRGTQFCPECADAFLSMDPFVLEAVCRGELDLSPTCE